MLGDICILRFIAALFTIVKIWKQFKCPPMDEWRKKMWQPYIKWNIIQL
jgi:hypothetical protein